MYTTVWEYHVAAGREQEFEQLYGDTGEWVKLFRTAPGFIRTLLWRDVADPTRYLTLDRWRSADDYAAFREASVTAYARIDTAGQDLTQAERHLGSFES